MASVAEVARPLTTIEAGVGRSLDLSELWAYRDLLYFLIWRDVKVRYKQTLFGAAWAIFQPLFAMLIFTLFFGRLAAIPSDGLPYPVFVFAGLLPWTFLANAVSSSASSLVTSANLITKIYFPRVIIPASAVVSGLVDLAVAIPVMLALMLFYGVRPGPSLALLPLCVIGTALFALALGLWLAALNVKYRDVRYAVPFLVQMGLFVTPVIYPLSLVPDRWRGLMVLNPVTGIIEGYRSALLGLPVNGSAAAVSLALTVLLLLLSARYFRSVERTFADVV